MAKKNNIPMMDIGDPDYLPPTLITGGTPEERDGEVAARIKDTMIRILNAMGNVPEIAEGDTVPNISLMHKHYEILGILMDKLAQRLERNNPQPTQTAAQARKNRKQMSQASISNELD